MILLKVSMTYSEKEDLGGDMNNFFYEGFVSKEEYYKVIEAAYKTSLVGVCIYDSKGDFIHHNKMHEILSGYTKEMLQTFSAQDLENMEKSGASSTMLVLQKREEIMFEQNMIPTNKQFITKGTPYFDEEGNLKYVISTIADLSKLIEIRENIQGSPPNISENLKLVDNLDSIIQPERFIYRSDTIRRIVEKTIQIKDSDATVLLLGESGTGKELVAKLIHEQSRRNMEKLVKINCSAIPDSLMESEMFGYESGSFTGGSTKGKKGLLEYANHGTVLLDEVGDMPIGLQAKMLRVLQEKEIQKIGHHDRYPIDVRFIASTNRDLGEMVARGEFREDLYHRLNVIPIKVPALRDRKEDIPILTNYFIEKMNGLYCSDKKISKELVAKLMELDFPGNIRELENLLERLVLFTSNQEITVEDFKALDVTEVNKSSRYEKYALGMGLKDQVEEHEKEILKQYLEMYGSARKMSQVLQTNHSTISKKLKRYGLYKE